MRGLEILLGELWDSFIDPAPIAIAFLAITGTSRLTPRRRMMVAIVAALLASLSTVFLGPEEDLFLAPFNGYFPDFMAIVAWSALFLALNAMWLEIRSARGF